MCWSNMFSPFAIYNLKFQNSLCLHIHLTYLPIYLPYFLLIESVKKYFWLGNQQENSWYMNLKLGKFCGELLLNTLFKVSASKTFWFLECWRQIVWQQSIAKECRWFFRGHFWRFFPLAQSWRWWVPLRDLPSGEEL